MYKLRKFYKIELDGEIQSKNYETIDSAKQGIIALFEADKTLREGNIIQITDIGITIKNKDYK